MTTHPISEQMVTAYAIDGIHPSASHHRMFGPKEAHTPRGLAANHGRRLMILGLAGDRIINTSHEGDIGGPAWEREQSYRAAFLAERRRRFARCADIERAYAAR